MKPIRFDSVVVARGLILAALVACVLFSLPRSARGEAFPVQSHQMCAEFAHFQMPPDICLPGDAFLDLCINAVPFECYWTNRTGGVGVIRWDVTGTATLHASGVNGGNPVPFDVAGGYVWVTRVSGGTLNWWVGQPVPSESAPTFFLTGTNPSFGRINVRIADGSGSVSAGGLLSGQIQLELAEGYDRDGSEGSGRHLSDLCPSHGTAVSNPGADSDGDGIPDGVDNARCRANANQQDSDGDGLGNVVDLCPSDPLDLCALGACCLPNGTCEKTAQDACSTAGGVYHGNNVECFSVGCVPLDVDEPARDGRPSLLVHVAPNPAHNQITCAFRLPESSAVRAVLHGAAGQTIQTLLEGQLPAGEHSYTWDLASTLGSGVYYLNLEAGDRHETRKLVVLP